MTRASDPKITIYGNKQRETLAAILFEVHKIGEDIVDPPRSEWFPFSQISKHFSDPTGEKEDWLLVSKWILEKKELI